VRVAQCLRNRLQHPGDLRQHIVIPQPQDLPALALQKARAMSVVQLGLFPGMLSAVKFDHPARLHAGKVGDVGANGVLAAKFVSVQLARTQAAPQSLLGVGALGTQLPGVLHPHPCPLPLAGEEGRTGCGLHGLRLNRRFPHAGNGGRRCWFFPLSRLR